MPRAIPPAALLLLLALTGGIQAAPEDGPPDEVVLGGARVPCEILGGDRDVLRVRIATRTYELERRGLEAWRGGERLLDPRRLDFVEALAPWLVVGDALLADRAREALHGLGAEGLPYLRLAAGRASRAEVREALAALIGDLGGVPPEREGGARAGFVERLTDQAMARLGLAPERRDAMGDALSGFLEALRAGAAREEAVRGVLQALEGDLEAAQLAELGRWLRGGR